MYTDVYHRLSNTPMGNELKWQLKEGMGVFLRTLSPQNRPIPFKSRPTQVLKNPDITDL